MCIAFNQHLIDNKCDQFDWLPFIMQGAQKGGQQTNYISHQSIIV